jgi:hypothetical protein
MVSPKLHRGHHATDWTCRRWRNRYHQAQKCWLLDCYGKKLLMSNDIWFTQHDRQSIHAATRKTLNKIKGFSDVKVEKVKEAISKCQVGSVFTLLISC